MAYPYPARTRITHGEILVFDKTQDCDGGPTNHTVNLPPGAYQLGLSAWSLAAGAAVTVKVYAFQAPDQTTAAAALSTVQAFQPHTASVTAVTVITVPTTSLYGGTSCQTDETRMYPYGLIVQVTCAATNGSAGFKLVAQGV